MKKTLLAASCLVALALPAKADLVLFNGNVHDSLVTIGGAGFGALPRLLNLQTDGAETGSNTPSGSTGDAKCSGTFFCSTPTLTAAGWTGGGQDVGVGVNWDQTGQNGAQLDALALTIYNGTTAVRTFNLAANLVPTLFSNTELRREPGNGNAVFLFVLNAAQQTQFNAILATPGSGNFVAGLSASAGCVGLVTCTFRSDDGPDSFVAVKNVGLVPVPVPVVGAGIPGLLAACFGMFGLNRWRRRKQLGLA